MNVLGFHSRIKPLVETIILCFIISLSIMAQQGAAVSNDEHRDIQKLINLADSHTAMALNYHKRFEFDKAMEYDFKALAIYESIKNDRGIAKCYVNLSRDFYHNSDYRSGAEYGEKAIPYCKKIGNQEVLAEAYQRSFESYLQLNQLTKALEMSDGAVAINQKLYPSSALLGNTLTEKGDLLKSLGCNQDALLCYQQSLAIYEKLNLKNDIALCLSNIGHIYLNLKQYAKARPYILKAIKGEENDNQWENYMLLSTIYENTGDFSNALVYYKKYKMAYDTLFLAQKGNAINELKTQYETGKKDALLSVKDEQISQQKITQWLMIGVAVVLAGFLFILYRSFKARTKANRLLAVVNQKLASKNTENELLLKEIHHRVKNNLEVISSLLALQSAQIDNPEIQEAMQASQNRVQSMGILHQKLYQSEHLAFVEMKNYFAQLTENILDSYNETDRIAIEYPMNEIELDVDTAMPLGLIVNELLTNSLKYAFPKGQLGKIKLSLKEIGKDRLQLCVADNGIGKAPNGKAQGTGFGTQLVDLLTRQLDGTLLQEVNNGTMISIQFKRLHPA